MWWVFRDRLGGLVSPLKRFYDHSQFRRKNREKQVKKSTFWSWAAPKTEKVDFGTCFSRFFSVKLRVIIKPF